MPFVFGAGLSLLAAIILVIFMKGVNNEVKT